MRDDWFEHYSELKETFRKEGVTDIEYPKTNGFLSTDIYKYNIINKETYFKKKEELQKGGILKYSNKDGIEIDDENRLYGEIFYQRRFISTKQIIIKNSDTINFTNCIISGDLWISCEPGRKVQINIDETIIEGTVVILNLGQGSSVNINRCNILNFLIENCSMEKVNINFSRIYNIRIEQSNLKNVQFHKNYLHYFKWYENIMTKVNFHFKQLSKSFIKKPPKSHKKRVKDQNKFNVYKFLPKDMPFISQFNENNLNILETFDFLKQSGHAKTDKQFKAWISEQSNIHSQPNVLGRIIMRFIGAFVKPIRVLLISILYYILYSLLYILPVFKFYIQDQIISGLDILTSFYFSGITFATIGYGDIVPVGISRFLTIAEGIGGILLMSTFLISMVRKYVEE